MEHHLNLGFGALKYAIPEGCQWNHWIQAFESSVFGQRQKTRSVAWPAQFFWL